MRRLRSRGLHATPHGPGFHVWRSRLASSLAFPSLRRESTTHTITLRQLSQSVDVTADAWFPVAGPIGAVLERVTVEQTRDRSMDITVFAGQRRGSASTSDFSPAALRQTTNPVIQDFLNPQIDIQHPRFRKLEANHE